MFGKVILALIIVIIIYSIWRVWHTCQTGHANSILGKLFAIPCHLLAA